MQSDSSSIALAYRSKFPASPMQTPDPRLSYLAYPTAELVGREASRSNTAVSNTGTKDVGTAVGESVGTGVGDFEGTGVGVSVGTGVGDSDGAGVGDFEGNGVGFSVCTTVGLSEGMGVGPSVGACKGEER